MTVSLPLQRSLARWTDFTGQFSAVDQVELHAQVSGYLTEIHFTDGQIVHQGDLLFVIDPRPYEIALQQAVAQYQTATAGLDLANKEVSRTTDLTRDDFASRELTATYPGASAKVLSQTVATPLEQQINGVEDMLYFSSQATGDGKLIVSVTFKLGTNLDTAQVLTQNRVAIALPRLPDVVQRLGVTVKKNSPDILMVIHLTSPNHTYDQLYMSNYATLHVKDALSRLQGVGDV